jgi:WD40 repeat protein
MAASSTPTESTYHKTLRVQGIPADHDTESAEGFIKRVLELDDRSSEFVRSITFSPYGKDTKVATITYDGTSKYLAGNGDKWEVPIRKTELCMEGHNDQVQSTRTITIDSNFLGFTPLRTFTEGEGHRIE